MTVLIQRNQENTAEAKIKKFRNLTYETQDKIIRDYVASGESKTKLCGLYDFAERWIKNQGVNHVRQK